MKFDLKQTFERLTRKAPPSEKTIRRLVELGGVSYPSSKSKSKGYTKSELRALLRQELSKKPRQQPKPKPQFSSEVIELNPQIQALKEHIKQRERERFLSSPEYKFAVKQRYKQLLKAYTQQYNILRPQSIRTENLNVLDTENHILKTPNVFKEQPENHILKPRERTILDAENLFRGKWDNPYPTRK